MSASHRIRGNQGPARVLAPTEDGDFPAAPGAYALLIRLETRFCADVGALGPVDLAAGRYLYLGSANGPGGLAARLRRHLRTDRKPHWHVDALTLRGAIEAVLAAPGGGECALVARALTLPGVTVPRSGFGSSDCRRCEAHLLAVADAGKAVLDALAGGENKVARSGPNSV